MYVPPEVYIPLQDNLRLADINAMYVEQLDLFLHYKQEKYLRILMEMTVLIYSSGFMALYKTKVNFSIYFDIWQLIPKQKWWKQWFYFLMPY